MKKLAFLLILGLSLLGLSGSLYAKDAAYVGVKKCATCHKKKEAGNQLAIWQKMKHAKAYDALASDKAKERGAKLGVNDPQKAPECLICHVTGYGKPAEAFEESYEAKDGVQCESCHGAGSLYRKKGTMKDLRKERLAGKHDLAKKTGFEYGNEETCKQCHVKEKTVDGKTYVNPSYQDFDYKKRLKEIAHPVPN